MKDQLLAAMEAITKNDKDAVAAAAEEVKKLPRTAEGLFDTAPQQL